MTANPKISVVMGVHNGAEYLSESITSVLSQSKVDLEFIIVDDGSDVAAADILLDCARADSRIRLLRQPRGGLTKALICGCAQARGEYIARHDNSDWSLPGRLAAQANALDLDDSLAFVSCWTEVCGPEGEFLSFSRGSGVAFNPTSIVSEDSPNGLSDGPSGHPTVMMRRRAYEQAGGYRAQFYFAQDWDLWYRMAEIGKFQMIERALYRSRVMPNSLSGRHKMEQERIAKLSFQSTIRRRQGRPEDDLLEAAQAIRPTGTSQPSALLKAKGFYFIGEQLRINGDLRARSYFLQALRIYPGYLKPWVRLAQIRLRGKI